MQRIRTQNIQIKGTNDDFPHDDFDLTNLTFKIYHVKRTEHLLDIIREVESEIESFHAMLDASVIVHQLGDVRISEGDQFLLYLRNLPSKVQEFLQLHQNAVTVQQLKTVQDYYIRTRVQGDLGSVHVAQPVFFSCIAERARSIVGQLLET